MTKLEHQGVKGMKWGKRKSYDVDAANKVRSAYMR